MRGVTTPGKPGAGKLDPHGPNKFEPTTKAKPYGGAGSGADHGSPGEKTAKQKKKGK